MKSTPSVGLFGEPHQDCAAIPANAVQMSPLVPDAVALEDLPPASLASMVMAAPPGTLERQYMFALCLWALHPGAPLTVMAPKEKGGSRIAKELAAFGCVVEATSRRHQRICRATRPVMRDADIEAHLDRAIAAGALRFVDDLGLWSQPGIFSWDRIDPGTALLLSVLPPFAGHGADLGCGIGVIAKAALASPKVTRIDAVDIDRRAIAAARRNVTDPRAVFHWADMRRVPHFKNLDFVLINPPFHDGGSEDKALGQAFVQQSQHVLRPGGAAWLVANRHLPYEGTLATAFSSVALRVERDGFKVYEALK